MFLKTGLKKALTLISFLLSSYIASAQFNQSAFENRIRPDSSLVNEVHFNFYNLNYVRNYEYTNDFHDGYTLYGTQLQPQLVYYAHPNLAITAGAFIRKDFGRNGISNAKPLFSVKYHKRNLTLIFGSLEGNIQHRYIEPLYDFERILTTPIEYGTQLLVERKKFTLDAWIAWQKMIYKGDPTKEEIIGGLSTESFLIKNDDWKLSIPAQFLAFHQGGQIDVLKEIPITTMFNGATGIKLHKDINGNIKQVYTDNYIAVYKDFSPDKRRAYQGGFGLWLNAGVESKWGSLVASYWKGNNFISIKGMPLYESVSDNLYSPGLKQSSRNIVSLRYAYQKELIPHLYLDVRFEPHIDLDHTDKQLQFNHSFFLTYKQDFKLFKAKKDGR
ncbi:hypothetical protein SAMN04488511_111151 [Pedobacter suwonensis]|uniref:Uncharacterized protein n=1 Tax=Pedobacter suwonensis TaxID=332999 RepID=A0A1I0TM28_9SPHI|nr:hypothetical protein [Pedobacter suwonensis]SFA52848.1 hypothetical protein SAMN04488511_111151 [Pedobacter suwonensis]